MAPYRSHRELECQRLQLYQSNHRVDQAERKKISLYGESRIEEQNLSFKSHIRTCSEVDNLRRICCEETHRATQLKQERDLPILSVLLSQIRDHTKNIRQNLCLKSKNVTIPVHRLVWRRSYVPTKPTYIPSTRSTFFLVCRRPPNTRNLSVFQDFFFWKPTSSRRTTLSHLRKFWKFGICLVIRWRLKVQESPEM